MIIHALRVFDRFPINGAHDPSWDIYVIMSSTSHQRFGRTLEGKQCCWLRVEGQGGGILFEIRPVFWDLRAVDRLLLRTSDGS